jgi:hypothetical protein
MSAGYRTELPDASAAPAQAGLLFGGLGPEGRLGDTWEWVGAAYGPAGWRPISSGSEITPRSNGAMVHKVRYDSFRGTHRTEWILIGGIDAQGPTATLWSIVNNSGLSWTMSGVGPLPAPRWNFAAASAHHFLIGFDTPILLMGGMSLVNGCPAPERSNLVLGLQEDSGIWTPAPDGPYAGGIWTASAVPLSSFSTVMPFGDNRATLCSPASTQPNVATLNRTGQGESGFVPSTLTWPMTPRSNYALASRPLLDGVSYEIVMFGGDQGNYPSPQGLLGDTWIFNPISGQFTQVTGEGPSPRRARHQFFYDATRNWYVLFGGHDGDFRDDTWVLVPEVIVTEQPQTVVARAGDTVVFRSRFGGPGGPLTHRWSVGPTPLTDGPTPWGSVITGATTDTLTITNVRPDDARGAHVCEATNECGGARTLNSFLFVRCPGDFNGDTFLDFFDYLDFVTCFETNECPVANGADFNGDGFIDFFDYSDFVEAFEAGC